MPLKRKRQDRNNGLQANEKLKQKAAHQTSNSAPWGWVVTEVSQIDEISLEHRLSTCNFSSRNKQPRCRNVYAPSSSTSKGLSPIATSSTVVQGESEDDVIIISDTEDDICDKKSCKSNPFCLNYLGQDFWEDEAKAEKRFFEKASLGRNPSDDSRKKDLPVGLKNLGATCYANASLQVWFRDLAFRSGVYACVPPEAISDEAFEDSPILQLQATFASLQYGNRSVFNPSKLVESLQLRKTEQQDAQEFSKLFMSHLDAEFKKQSLPKLQSLIADQFQGNQVYGTICHQCQNKSERIADFLEIEINFEKNCTLEDRIEASLANEVLSGDNRYSCPRCDSLQDATRYTELRKLPPVLHFSLLRFVYDISTMERKKSKNSVTFPTILDMDRFMASGQQDVDTNISNSSTNKNVYELRGILLHKGSSAYHGHYEAQVKDSLSDEWFQFNDDVVTKAKGFGDNEFTGNAKGYAHKQRVNARKRRRVEDSDEETKVRTKASRESSCIQSEQNISITSRDAYMLIYSRKDHATANHGTIHSAAPIVSQPPDRVMKVVEHDNAAHDAACAQYDVRKSHCLSRFHELRDNIRKLYSRWHPTALEDSLVVSRQALEAYLGEHAILTSLRPLASETDQTAQDEKIVLGIDDIVCEHGSLDPLKARDMKLVKQHAISQLDTVSKCLIKPILKPSDICANCVASIFLEKCYEIRHPLQVKMVDDVSNVPDDDAGIWVSKKWFREWRLPRPRTYNPLTGDLPPDAPEFLNHVQCEHGALTLNTTNRRRISQQAASILLDMFPTWKPMPGDTDVCALCEADVRLSKEDKKELRKQIEEEKNLTLDLNCPSDTDSLITVISRSDWEKLQTMYSCGPLIALTKTRDENGLVRYSADISTCAECRLKWKTDWVETEIVVRLHGRERKGKDLTLQTKASASNHRANGGRQSRRLRQIKENAEHRKILITKTTTVKEIKIALSIEFSIPTICQRLYHGGNELGENEATVASLNILANDTLDLREVDETVEIDTDSDETPAAKRRREEGEGFGGTLLGGGGGLDLACPRERDNGPTVSVALNIERACPACTFVNVATAVACEMCESALE
ncbi:hypothetical protein CVT24_005920 [Panaeolus cyanescens]|uniref:ubiquitinyl hydrolase 1 n=1 Tax=Panaeolus cyanescens TaxID=181874 RepID=A0A409VCU6_9AGAR|nr:hypothetical protein CVT24_005920 [Panaeolus cyanescens]